MAIKSVSIRIEQEMLDKLAYIAEYEGRSVNSWCSCWCAAALRPSSASTAR